MNLFGKKMRNSNRNHASRSKRLSFESMEARQMMTIIPIVSPIISNGPPMMAPPPSGPMAEGTITLDSSTGVLDIDLSQTHDNNVQIYTNHRAGNGAGNLPDLLTVQLSNINSPHVWAVDPNVNPVTKIVVHSHAGNDFVDNRTSVTMVAYGGNGNDTFLGGAGTDFLIGGTGNNYLDGRGGGDVLVGGGGTNVMFGDDGSDTLYGGSGANYMFGGNGNDYLASGTGSNVLYGGAGTNTLVRKSAADLLYAAYGPTVSVSDYGVKGFDFFDRYLKDPNVRSMARYDYYRDDFLYRGGLTRNDMLEIYKEISTSGTDPNYPFAIESAIAFDGTVTANECADLKALTSTKLSIDPATRFLASRIANGDRANAGYQGAPLGNLAAGQAGDHLETLVDKWFEGDDVPWAADAKLSTLRYEQASGSLFVNGPSIDDIRQNYINDCYLMSALGEVAQHSPQSIQNMFIDNGDGTWSVRFFRNGVANYVTVNCELPVYGYGTSGVAWGAGFGTTTDPYGETFANNYDNPNNELWVALAEKAYVQMNESGWIGQDGNNSYHGIDNGFTHVAFTQITDKPASYFAFANSSAPTVINAFNAGHPIVFESKSSGTDAATVVADHTYMLTGYDPQTQTFELSNTGQFQVYLGSNVVYPMTLEFSWADVLRNFNGMTMSAVL